MDGFSPFRQVDRWEIRQVAKIVFYGGSVDDEAIYPLYLKWKFYFSIFDKIIEHRSGDYRCPPFQTIDWIYQPYKTMQVFDLLRELWIQKLKSDQENNSR